MTPGPAETVARVLELYSGGSTFPALAQLGSGERLVLKLRATGSGSRSLTTEFLGNLIAAKLGLRVPSARPVYVPAEMPWEIGTDEFDDTLRRSAGWNLGVAHIEGAHPIVDFDLQTFPPHFLARLALVDDLLQNVDRTLKNPNLLVADGDAWPIDFGGCLFLQRIIDARLPYRFGLPAGHLLAGPKEREVVQITVEPDALGALAREVPSQWLEEIGMTSLELERRLTDYVRAFSGRDEPRLTATR